MGAVKIGVRPGQVLMLGLELFKFVLEVLNVLLFAFTEGTLRCPILCSATLKFFLECKPAYRRRTVLTMRIFETLSLSCCVFDRLLRRSSS